MVDAAAYRLDAPAFHCNHAPIGDVLHAHVAQVSGQALEIGSGTGQHVVSFARRLPNLLWWPSDRDPAHLRSIEAWRALAGLPNVETPLFVDASEDRWGLGEPGHPPERVEVIISLNVIHISPWYVAEGIMRGAGRHLADSGWLFLYGPFKRDGRHTAESNARFDASLHAQNPAWGVRDIADLEALANRSGLVLDDVVAMPANNHVLVFRQ